MSSTPHNHAIKFAPCGRRTSFLSAAYGGRDAKEHMNLDSLAERYKVAIGMSDLYRALHEINFILKEAVSRFPKGRTEDLSWFSAALQDDNKKWFVAKLMGKVNPAPKSL